MEHNGNTFVFQKDSSYVSAAAAKLIAQSCQRVRHRRSDGAAVFRSVGCQPFQSMVAHIKHLIETDQTLEIVHRPSTHNGDVKCRIGEQCAERCLRRELKYASFGRGATSVSVPSKSRKRKIAIPVNDPYCLPD
jgi:hypothetical protein